MQRRVVEKRQVLRVATLVLSLGVLSWGCGGAKERVPDSGTSCGLHDGRRVLGVGPGVQVALGIGHLRGDDVSGEDIAKGIASDCYTPARSHGCLIPASTLTMGKFTPIRPVEHTSTCFSAQPSRRATAHAMARA